MATSRRRSIFCCVLKGCLVCRAHATRIRATHHDYGRSVGAAARRRVYGKMDCYLVLEMNGLVFISLCVQAA